jgi:hypothetical protein
MVGDPVEMVQLNTPAKDLFFEPPAAVKPPAT